MAQLLYKTRAGENPQGKPRVYFTCHSEDFTGCFEEISGEILKISNCAIYYYAPYEQPQTDEEYFLNLNQMQLFVMPVTSRFLCQQNRARDKDYQYAVENHIPVLPLMLEPGLETLFNERCGDLQFLDKYNSDFTAIPYAEKLKKYLEAVLVGDELAQKVREAFDAYIFLSYRKKDRKYAQELMRLIHRSDFCRDIAIWYDEFLTPGENFNGAIQAALEKSCLFALAVTPNLVIEDNYVMCIEYPMAKDTGKPVLAAQMLPTDQQLLQKKYENLPAVVDPQNTSDMDSALIEHLRGIALRQNDEDPQHNFFIGLAYLFGIDVEVDHEKALKLITGAAEKDLPEAMRKLVSMYETGEGVKRDYMTAISWREKLVEQTKQLYEQTQTADACFTYATELLELSDAWKEIGKLDSAKTVAKMLWSLMELNTRKTNDSKTLLYRAVSCNKLGKIAQEEGLLKEAKHWFEEEIRIIQQMPDADSDVWQWEMSINYYFMSELALKEGNLSEAKKLCMQCSEICQKLRNRGMADAFRALGLTFSRMGDLAQCQGDLEEAKQWESRCLELRTQIAESQTPQAIQDLAASYVSIGLICRKEGNLAEAKQYHTRALEIMLTQEEIGTVLILRNLSVVYGHLAMTALAEQNIAEAKQWFLKSLELQRKLRTTGSMLSARDLGATCIHLGTIALNEGNIDEAEKMFQECYDLLKGMADTETVDSLQGLSNSCRFLGDIAQKRGGINEAKRWYREFLDAQLWLERVASEGNRDDLAFAYFKLGYAEKDEQMLRKAAEIYQQLLQEHPQNDRYRQNLEKLEKQIQKIEETTKKGKSSVWNRIFHRKKDH